MDGKDKPKFFQSANGLYTKSAIWCTIRKIVCHKSSAALSNFIGGKIHGQKYRSIIYFGGKATAGDREALETVILSVQDLVFNLSLRMLGAFADAEGRDTRILLLKSSPTFLPSKRKAPFPLGYSALR